MQPSQAHGNCADRAVTTTHQDGRKELGNEKKIPARHPAKVVVMARRQSKNSKWLQHLQRIGTDRWPKLTD